MASAAGLRAGRAYVELGVDNNRLSAGLRAAANQVKAFSSSLRAVGMGMAGIGLGLAAPLGLATTAFAGFEKQMARVKAISGATPEEFARLSVEAKRLGEVTEYSAAQAAAMMTEFATRGFKTNQIIAATAPTLQAATAGGLELAEAAAIIGDVMGGMRLDASKAGEATDKLAFAFTNSATDLRQLGEAFEAVGPNAAEMGFDIDEVTAALMVLANNAQKGEKAGTALRGMFETLKNPPEEARKELEKLGVKLDDGTGKFKRLDAIIGDMQSGLAKLSQTEKAAAIGKIFTNKQTTAASILTGVDDKGTSNVDTMRGFQSQLITEAEGTGARVQATQLDTLWGSWKLIESAMEGVAIIVGEALAPALRELGQMMTDGIAALNMIVKRNRDWLPVIGKTALALVGAGSAITAVGLGLLGVSAVMAGLATGLTWVLAPLFAVKAGILALMSPVGLVVGAIAAGVVAFATMTDAGRSMTRELGRALAEFGTGFANVASSIAKTFGDAWGGIINAIKGGDFALAGRIAWKGMEIVWQKGVNWLTGLWRGFTSYFVETFHKASFALSQIVNNVWSGLESVWFESFNLIAVAWGNLMDYMRKTFTSMSAGFKVQWIAMQATIGSITFKEAEKQAAETLMEALKQREKIDGERKESNKEIERQRADIETRRINVESSLIDRQIKEGNERRAARAAQEAEATKKLAEAESELARLLIDAQQLDRSMFESDGEMYLKDQAPTKKGLDAVAERATGMGASGGSAGTFDANVLRFLAGTGNKDLLQKRQTEAAERAAERLQRLIDIARDSKDTYT